MLNPYGIGFSMVSGYPDANFHLIFYSGFSQNFHICFVGDKTIFPVANCSPIFLKQATLLFPELLPAKKVIGKIYFAT
jgi:hypothetical protein